MDVIAQHPRTFDKGKQIEQEAHIKELVDRKKQARQHRGQNRLIHAAPSCAQLLEQALERGYSLRSLTRELLQLLDEYGATELEIAIKDALYQKVPHPNAVRISLVKHREQRQQLPPVRLDLPQDKRIRDLVIKPHSLEQYDQLLGDDDNED